MSNSRVWTWVFVGSTVGGVIPSLWGAGIFSFSSMLFSALGAFGGIWFAYKMAGY